MKATYLLLALTTLTTALHIPSHLEAHISHDDWTRKASIRAYPSNMEKRCTHFTKDITRVMRKEEGCDDDAGLSIWDRLKEKFPWNKEPPTAEESLVQMSKQGDGEKRKGKDKTKEEKEREKEEKKKAKEEKKADKEKEKDEKKGNDGEDKNGGGKKDDKTSTTTRTKMETRTRTSTTSSPTSTSASTSTTTKL